MRCNCAPSRTFHCGAVWCQSRQFVPVRLSGSMVLWAGTQQAKQARQRGMGKWWLNVAHPHNPCKSAREGERVSPHRVELAQARKKKKPDRRRRPGWCQV